MPGAIPAEAATPARSQASRRLARLLLALAGLGAAVVLPAWCSQRGRLSFSCGLLPSAHDQYLDNTGHIFQRGSWRLGNATHIWGECYGIKLGRAYFTIGVTHVNPNASAEQAGD